MEELLGLSELLEVTDTFQISGQGLVMMPDFSLKKLPISTVEAVVLKPDGGKRTSALNLHSTHFNIRDPSVSVDRRWRIVPTFPGLTKADVPIGSRIFVDTRIAAILRDDVEL